MQPRMSMITLGVKDLERSIRFYSEGLGFPKMDSPPSVAFFTLNGTWLGLYGREALAEDAGVSADGSGFSGFAIAHNVHSDQDVDDVLAHAVAAGATLVKPGQKVFWGGYSGYFKDPDGYLWEVAHNPFFWVGPMTNERETAGGPNNIFQGLPECLPEEWFETVVQAGHIRIERIVSQGHSSPASDWYDQDEHEWVMVLQGAGILLFDDGKEVALRQGDYLNIPAHVRHRVKWTDPEQVTVWLAVFYS